MWQSAIGKPNNVFLGKVVCVESQGVERVDGCLVYFAGQRVCQNKSVFFSDHITLDRAVPLFFPLCFMFPLFLFVLLKVSPRSFSGSVPAIRATCQSTNLLPTSWNVVLMCEPPLQRTNVHTMGGTTRQLLCTCAGGRRGGMDDAFHVSWCLSHLSQGAMSE